MIFLGSLLSDTWKIFHDYFYSDWLGYRMPESWKCAESFNFIFIIYYYFYLNFAWFFSVLKITPEDLNPYNFIIEKLFIYLFSVVSQILQNSIPFSRLLGLLYFPWASRISHTMEKKYHLTLSSSSLSSCLYMLKDLTFDRWTIGTWF